MILFLANEKIDRQIKEIRQKIVLSMNGVTSDNMKKYGIEYKKNYGVSIIHLREIASLYKPNYDLAQRLWNIEIRECMILATLLQPADTFTKETAENWINKVNNIELAEQITMNLLSKTNFAIELVFDWIESDNLWKQITGTLLGVHIYKQFNTEKAKEIVDIALSKSETEKYHLYKAVALFLSRLSRNGNEITKYIEDKIKLFSSSENIGKKYIQNEVKEEILFSKKLPE